MKVGILKNLFCLALVLVCISSYGQEDEEKPEKKVAKKELTFWDKNAFFQYRLGWDGGSTPSFDYTQTAASPPDNKGRTYATWISIVSWGFDSRLNVINFMDKASLSVSVPVDLSLGISVIEGIGAGFFALSSGFFVDGNFLNHSTYNNIDKNGFSIGLGIRAYKAPLIGIQDEPGRYAYKKLVFGPAVRFMYKKDRNNSNNRVYYVETGFPESSAQNILGEEVIPANFFIRLHFGQILNY